MASLKYLTKSKYQLAMQCPTKLFYSENKQYANKSSDNTFLEALVEGGFQVGELAKQYFSEGKMIESLNIDEAVKQTAILLAQKNVVIFEAAIMYQQCLVRVDILEKIGNSIRIIEVKAKSCDGYSNEQFLSKKGDKIQAAWRPYIEDVAFQKWVVKGAMPSNNVVAKLMLVNKTAVNEIAALNQAFRINRDDHFTTVNFIGDADKIRISTRLLTTISVDALTLMLFDEIDLLGRSYSQKIAYYSSLLASSDKVKPKLTAKCSSCEFRVDPKQLEPSQKSGFLECWQQITHLSAKALAQPLSIDVWNTKSKPKWLDDGIYLMNELTEEHFTIKQGNNGLSQSERQWKQVEKVITNDNTPYLKNELLQDEVNTWQYPLHFIDFETSRVAIPFHKGKKPYEQVAFQYSHHTVQKDGSAKHAGQFLNTEPGDFPNYSFVRSLKDELSKDNGTIFMYYPHENRVLNDIFNQLNEDSNPPEDKDELKDFILSITEGSGDNKGKWCGERFMVDLCELVKRFYYDPLTKGSNSIKDVLPAVLARSSFLQQTYSKPIYGSVSGIFSYNFKNHSWFSKNCIDPYKSLENILNEDKKQGISLISSSEKIADGGAAMTAYSYLQYVDMTEIERQALRTGLLRYCELDTMAMVMIYQAWMDWLENGIDV